MLKEQIKQAVLLETSELRKNLMLVSAKSDPEYSKCYLRMMGAILDFLISNMDDDKLQLAIDKGATIKDIASSTSEKLAMTLIKLSTILL